MEFRRRGIAEARLMGAGADGADWCQQLVDRHCPHAVRSLDFYDVAARVAAFSKTVWGHEAALAGWYAEERLHRLKHQGPGDLLASLAVWSPGRCRRRTPADWEAQPS